MAVLRHDGERCFYCAQRHISHPNALCEGYRAGSAGPPQPIEGWYEHSGAPDVPYSGYLVERV
jgi:hypothetical protein